ncbi:MAG: protoporphyrinogen oxidase [Ignavibacteriae bacterium]|nr:MAG: protoporphyrinogen oxidase [Ignavibacteriota bacterium]
MDKKRIIIIGAGISGLATAHWLEKEGYDVTIIEEKTEPGGAMQTKLSNNFLIDFGTNSGTETTPKIRELVNDIGLSNEMIYANENSKIRYILKNNELTPLPTSPTQFLKTKLFSNSAKLRILKEPFIGKSEDGYNQSIADFVRRRLGDEFLENAIDPFVSGVFAGNPAELSVKSAFPKLYRLEEKYGGLIKGTIKGARERRNNPEKSKQYAKMFSFKNGMQSFPRAIEKNLKGKKYYGSIVESISKQDKKIVIEMEYKGKKGKLTSDVLLSTIPAYKLSKISDSIDKELTKHLNEIYYPPVLVLFLGYDREVITRELDGFGFLIPSKEKKSFLGAIWSSSIFVNRTSRETEAFTIFVGGTKNPDFKIDDVKNRIDEVLKEFHDIMGIDANPTLIEWKFWNKAIPQYNIGYREHEEYFYKFEENNPGIFLGGNYIGGISVGDCIKSSYNNFEKIKKYLSKT